MQTYYGGMKNSKGELIFSGQAYGVPDARAARARRTRRTRSRSTRSEFSASRTPSYDWRQFDLDRDMPIIDKKVGFVDAVNPDLRAYEAAGGKLLMYAGWRDNGITPENTVLYYESVLREMGPEQDDWMRMFLVPGMRHCGGGPGPNTFDSITALEQWREKGRSPGRDARHEPRVGPEAPDLRVPRVREVQGLGRSEGRRELGVHEALSTPSRPRAKRAAALGSRPAPARPLKSAPPPRLAWAWRNIDAGDS